MFVKDFLRIRFNKKIFNESYKRKRMKNIKLVKLKTKKKIKKKVSLSN